MQVTADDNVDMCIDIQYMYYIHKLCVTLLVYHDQVSYSEYSVLYCDQVYYICRCMVKIRPHRFGGEGVLIGVQSATLNAQVTFVYIAVAISALAGGGALKNFAPKPFPCWCFRNFSDVFWGLDLKRVLIWNFGSFWGDFGTGKEEKQKQNSVHRDVLEGFRMSEQEDTFASSPELGGVCVLFGRFLCVGGLKGIQMKFCV